MAKAPRVAWSLAVVLLVAFACGVYFGYWNDGGGEEYGDLTFLPAA